MKPQKELATAYPALKAEDDEPEDDPEDEEPEDDGEGHSPFENTQTTQQPLAAPDLDPKKVIEAALFLGNRTFTYAELSLLAKTSVRKGKSIVMQLQKEFNSSDRAIEITADALQVTMQVKPDFLGPISQLSKNIEVSKKALKIVALIAKKGKLKQSELHKYFRGDIYAYIAELKEQGYVSSEKAGNTRLLKPTSKFTQTFQLGKTDEAFAEPQQATLVEPEAPKEADTEKLTTT